MFWRPEAPEARIPGELRFDADGVLLRLFEDLDPVEMTDGFDLRPTRIEVPLIHGMLHNRTEAVSVVGVSGVTLGLPFGHGHQDLIADAALFGGHLDQLVFDDARVTFDCLAAWADPPPIAETEVQPQVRTVVRTGRLELARAEVRGREVLLQSLVSGRWGDSVHLDQRVALTVACGPLALRDVLAIWVRPMGDLLVVCLGRPASITHLELHGVDVNGERRWFRVSQELVQRAPADDVSVAKIRNYDAPTLLLPDDPDVPFAELLPAWFSLLEDVPEVVTLLCAPYYASFIFSEHRYANAFQAAEALAQACFPGPEEAKAAHKKRVAAIVDAATAAGVQEEHVQWAKRVLTNANSKRLRQLVEELFLDAGKVGAVLLSAAEDVPRLFASARTGVSHGGATGQDALSRYWLGQALVWVLRMHLVREMGVQPARVEEQVLVKPSFKRCLESIRALAD